MQSLTLDYRAPVLTYDLSQNNWFVDLRLTSFFRCTVLFRRPGEKIWNHVFKLVFFDFIFWCFLDCYQL